MDAVTILLDNDGLIVWPAPESQAGKVSARQKGKRDGVKLIFSSIVMLPFAAALSIWHEVDSPVPLLVPLTVFLLGLTRLLYSVIFEEERPPAKPGPQPLKGRALSQNMTLPPPSASVTPLKRVSTADMLYSPSVVENTTNLLDNK
jgi:hypothetical protein